MERGDISSWTSSRLVVVLEGVLAKPVYVGRVRKKLAPPEEWGWSVYSIKHVVDYVQRKNVAVDVVTFMGQEVGDAAAEYLERYEVPVSSVDVMDLPTFQQSLLWRPDVQTVVDSDLDRLMHYGQRGYLTEFGGSF